MTDNNTASASVSTFPRRDQPASQASVSSGQPEALFERGAKYLEVNPERDLLTSHVNSMASSVDADMFLEEGMSLSGTHYGINLISKSGVVLVTKDARILPSKKRPSRIAAQKIVNAGEMVVDRLQADLLTILADNSKTIVGDAIFGVSFVSTEKAQWRVQRSLRQMAPREKRVDVLHKEATEAFMPAENGYDVICQAQDAQIEAQVDGEQRPRLAAVAAGADA